MQILILDKLISTGPQMFYFGMCLKRIFPLFLSKTNRNAINDRRRAIQILQCTIISSSRQCIRQGNPPLIRGDALFPLHVCVQLSFSFSNRRTREEVDTATHCLFGLSRVVGATMGDELGVAKSPAREYARTKFVDVSICDVPEIGQHRGTIHLSDFGDYPRG